MSGLFDRFVHWMFPGWNSPNLRALMVMSAMPAVLGLVAFGIDEYFTTEYTLLGTEMTATYSLFKADDECEKGHSNCAVLAGFTGAFIMIHFVLNMCAAVCATRMRPGMLTGALGCLLVSFFFIVAAYVFINILPSLSVINDAGRQFAYKAKGDNFGTSATLLTTDLGAQFLFLLVIWVAGKTAASAADSEVVYAKTQ